MNIKLNKNDVLFEYIKKAKGAGGQKLNKTSSAIRLTHKPTGIVIESSEGRSQAKNKEIALKKLEEKLIRIEEEEKARLKQQNYNEKDQASFASQIRTYRLCGNNQGVVDHRTGINHPNTSQVLKGDIERFLRNGS